MLTRIMDYALCMLLGALVGAGVGVFVGDPLDGGAIGLICGFFLGVAVQTWRNPDEANSFENRNLGD